MKISLEIPDQFSLLGDAKAWEKELKLNTALLLYRQGRFTIGQATRFSGLDKIAFMQACAKQEIPVLDYTAEELDAELEMLRDLMA